MIKEVLGKSDLVIFPLLSFFLFLIFFISVIVWVYRKGRRDHYYRMSTLALSEEELHTSPAEKKA